MSPVAPATLLCLIIGLSLYLQGSGESHLLHGIVSTCLDSPIFLLRDSTLVLSPPGLELSALTLSKVLPSMISACDWFQGRLSDQNTTLDNRLGYSGLKVCTSGHSATLFHLAHHSYSYKHDASLSACLCSIDTSFSSLQRFWGTSSLQVVLFHVLTWRSVVSLQYYYSL